MCFCCSFFVVEDHILNTTSGLVNRAYIDELWDMALSKAVAVLRTHIVSDRLMSCETWPCLRLLLSLEHTL